MFESTPHSGAGRKTVHLEAGQIVEGTILAISGGLVILDIGSSADATLDFNEVSDQKLKVGDRFKATVKNPRKDGPELTVSLGRGGGAINTAQLELALEGGTPVSGTVTASNKGGFSVDLAGVRAFCPISQIDSGYVNEPEAFVGQTLDFQILEIREGGRNVVVSRKKLLQDERRKAEDVLAEGLRPGALVEGAVKSTVRHGAIIDLGRLEGFIPLAELSRARINSAEDVVTVGETVKAQILSVERTEKGMSIRLSLKALEAPTETSNVQKDEILLGKVVKHVGSGVIVATGKGEGLVPTRELALAPGADHRRSYPIDTELKVVVVNRDSSGKVRFSVDRVAQVEERNNFREFAQGRSDASSENVTQMGSLGDLMAQKFPALKIAQAKAKIETSKAAASTLTAASTPVTAQTPATAQTPDVEVKKTGALPPSQKPPRQEHLGIKRRQK